jgi:methyltransferase (TIGR00027 family)
MNASSSIRSRRPFSNRRLRLAALASRLPLIGGIVPWFIDRRWPGPRPSGVLRTRVIDDAVRGALSAGCSQLVLLGAGYDTRAYRLPEAADKEIFEVDHATTQALKRATIAKRLSASSPHVHFVPVDFEHDSLEQALAAAGLRGGMPTCVVWEGVFSYLTIEAIDATLDWAVNACAAGSRLILTYIDEAALRPTDHRPAWIAAVDDAGEPFITGLDPALAADFFAERGLRLVANESTRDSAERLAPAAASTIPGFYRVALLEVVGTSDRGRIGANQGGP